MTEEHNTNDNVDVTTFRNTDSQAYKDEKAIYEDYQEGIIGAVDFEKAEQVQQEFQNIIGNPDKTDAELRMASQVGLFRMLATKLAEDEAKHTSPAQTIKLLDYAIKAAVSEYKGYLAKNLTDEEAKHVEVNEQVLNHLFEVETK